MIRRALVLALCLTPSVLWAQNFTAEDLEKVIKQDLGKDFEKMAQGPNFDYDVKGTAFYILYNSAGKFVNVYATFKGEVGLEKLNAWNQRAIHSRAFFNPQLKTVTFEVPMSIAAGATRAQVKNLVENADREFELFKKHLGIN